MDNKLNNEHSRVMEFFVENINYLDNKNPKSMLMFLNIEKDIQFIIAINKSFSLISLYNGNKFVIYGNGRVHNTRYIYGLTRSLNSKHIDYFSDRIIRPSLYWYYGDKKFDLDKLHIDEAQVFGVLFTLDNNDIKEYESNEEAISYAFGSKELYLKSKKQILNDRKTLKTELKNFANLDYFNNNNNQ